MIEKQEGYVIVTKPRFNKDKETYELPLQFLKRNDNWHFQLVEDIFDATLFANKTTVNTVVDFLRKDYKKSGNSNYFIPVDGFSTINDPYYLATVNGLSVRHVVKSIKI